MQAFNVLNVQGRNVVSLTPTGKKRPSALVDIESLKRIVGNLPTPDLYTQKHLLTKKIDQSPNATEFLKALEDEIAYKETIMNIEALNMEDTMDLLEFEAKFKEEVL